MEDDITKIKNYIFENDKAVFFEYINMRNVQDVCIQNEGEVECCIKGKWKIYKDDRITSIFLMAFIGLLHRILNIPFNKINCNITVEFDQDVRLQIFTPPIVKFPSLIFRVNKRFFSLSNFNIENKNIVFLKEAMKNKKNIMIAGATGSGKTSFLNALIKYIPKAERIVTIEDNRELKTPKNNTLNLLVNENTETDRVIEGALRSSPNRLLIGEILIYNIRSLLNILNTGHNGLLATIHADSVDDIDQAVATRASSDPNVNPQSAKETVNRYFDIFIFVNTNEKRTIQIKKLK